MNVKHILTITMLSTILPMAHHDAHAEKYHLDYSIKKDIKPSIITVKKGEKVQIEIMPEESASGCMSAIKIPGLWNQAEPLIKGKKIIMQFTPDKPGQYPITCDMNVRRGTLIVH